MKVTHKGSRTEEEEDERKAMKGEMQGEKIYLKKKLVWNKRTIEMFILLRP